MSPVRIFGLILSVKKVLTFGSYLPMFSKAPDFEMGINLRRLTANLHVDEEQVFSYTQRVERALELTVIACVRFTPGY